MRFQWILFLFFCSCSTLVTTRLSTETLSASETIIYGEFIHVNELQAEIALLYTHIQSPDSTVLYTPNATKNIIIKPSNHGISSGYFLDIISGSSKTIIGISFKYPSTNNTKAKTVTVPIAPLNIESGIDFLYLGSFKCYTLMDTIIDATAPQYRARNNKTRADLRLQPFFNNLIFDNALEESLVFMNGQKNVW
ncbi:MAG: hypothetical protein OCC49_13575 [Fibrobacterales bacterium]